MGQSFGSNRASPTGPQRKLGTTRDQYPPIGTKGQSHPLISSAMLSNMSPFHPPNPSAVIDAHQRIKGLVDKTPILRFEAIDRCFGMEVFFKCEHLQKTGSFKFRGASHAVSWLEPTCPGVATHSSGNHGAALAKAAQSKGIGAEVVMPDNAIEAKVAAVEIHGGRVHRCAPTQKDREAGLAHWVEQGLVAIPPYDHPHIIAGQGTLALELMEQVPNLDAIFSPIGGGGLIAGIALATLTQDASHRPDVIGVEPLGANDTHRSLQKGQRVEDHHPETIADGLRALVGALTFEIIQQHVKEVVCVSEDEIIQAMHIAWRDLKQVIEPSGAVALAGLLANLHAHQGKRVAIVLSGGNMNLPLPKLSA